MKIETVVLSHLATNCYMISSDNAAIVIDPAVFSERLENFLKENSDKQRLILLTHAHFDHIGAAEVLRNRTNTKIAAGINEAPYFADTFVNLSDRFHAHINPFEVDIKLKDGEKFDVGDLNIEAIETPGHTVGGMCYYIENCLFSGDTLFYESIGRSDFHGGNPVTLFRSAKGLLSRFSDETPVYSGHGPKTTIGHEKEFNPYLR